MNDLLARLREQFETQYEVADNGCWLWAGPHNSDGYGRAPILGGYALAHRLSYELYVGSIPDGLDLDHLCCQRLCVNYEHLEPVTRRENILRGNGLAAQNARKEECPDGHPYRGDNLYTKPNGGRICRTCHRVAERVRRATRVPERKLVEAI